MRHAFIAAAGLLAVCVNQAHAKHHANPPADRAALREQTIETARKAVECVFPHGAARDEKLAAYYSRLDRMLIALPGATTAERQKISEQAYKIRLELEGNKFPSDYKYYYVEAAHAVAMAAQVSTSATFNGFPSRVSSGDRDEVSAELTNDAYDSVKVWLKLTGPRGLHCQ